jgi:hypothetical protein
MKTRFLLFLSIILAVASPLAAKSGKASVRIGAEAAIEDNFTRFGLGPLFDVNIALSKQFELEGYIMWTPYFEPRSLGSLYGEADAYFHILLKNRVSIHPALCVSETLRLDPLESVVTVEPSLKLDIRNFFLKACAPLQVFPDFVPYAYLEPGVHLNRLTLKIRGTAALEPFALDGVRWWADYAFGKNDLYAYGVVRGFEEGGEIAYNQYVGFYIGF